MGNPEVIRNKQSRKRARRKSNGEFAITKKELRQLYLKPCFYCGEVTQHLDHVIPISRGGRHSLGNLVPACAYCNLQKSDRFITEWQKAIRQENRKRSL
jgi:5-methylcytosine-specific restriction endonuclease McrA